MDVKSVIKDKKINATSILVEMEVGQYLSLADHLVNSNPFQRKRVRGSRTVYSLLKRDFFEGCVIPPIVLAYTENGDDFELDADAAFENRKESFLLLDGLQRTYTLLDLRNEISDPVDVDAFLSRKIRCEVYQGINRLGILYRMLTLNTGQTTMSLRHQIEIMYLDLLDTHIEHIRLLRDADRTSKDVSAYSFREAIDGFNAYVTRSESPLDRSDILDNIASLESISKEHDNDLFREFVMAWDRFVTQIHSLKLKIPDGPDGESDDDYESESNGNSAPRLWGSTGLRAFKRPQALSGFGAAVGILLDSGENIRLSTIDFSQLVVGDDGEEFMSRMNKDIEDLNQRAKRIGNAQRLYFRQLFRMLLWPQSGSFMNLSKAGAEAISTTMKIGI